MKLGNTALTSRQTGEALQSITSVDVAEGMHSFSLGDAMVITFFSWSYCWIARIGVMMDLVDQSAGGQHACDAMRWTGESVYPGLYFRCIEVNSEREDDNYKATFTSISKLSGGLRHGVRCTMRQQSQRFFVWSSSNTSSQWRRSSSKPCLSSSRSDLR